MNGQAITLTDEVQGHAIVAKTFWPWCRAQLHAHRQVVIEARLAEDCKTDKQRKYLHGCVLTNISQQAVINGQKFPLAVFKEWYRNEFLGFKTVTHRNPFTGKKTRRRERQSTESLGVKGYAEYIERVIAHASTELGVTFPEEWHDPETGEIFSLKDMTQRRAARVRMKELGVEA